MSYEGYTEYLTVSGKYFTLDCYDGTPSEYDGEPVEYFHDVDQTNGYDADDPSTCCAEKIIIGRYDVWHEDHYGNRYATEHFLYAPAENSSWRRVNG